MVDDTHPVPNGADVALTGLDDAAARLHNSVEGVLRGSGGQVATSLTESLFWIAALDDHGRKTLTNYDAIRDASSPVVGGLVYARNFHAHELAVSTSEMAITVGRLRVVKTPPGADPPPRGRGTLFAIELRWVAFDELPPPKLRERWNRDAMYRAEVELRPLTGPIDEARLWLREQFDVVGP